MILRSNPCLCKSTLYGIIFSGILSNLLVVTTVRHHDQLMSSTTNLLLLNLCFSNLIVSFLVKPISAIYGAYSISTGNWQVQGAKHELLPFFAK